MLKRVSRKATKSRRNFLGEPSSRKSKLQFLTEVNGHASTKTIADESLDVSAKCQNDRERQRSVVDRSPELQEIYVADNIVSRTYRFPLQDTEGYLSAEETMRETCLTFHVPILFLQLCVEKEEKKIKRLQSLGELPERWDAIIKRKLRIHNKYLKKYKSHLEFLINRYRGPYFKKSVDKGEEDLDFVATNLHLQQFRVEDTTKLAPQHNHNSESSPEPASGHNIWMEYNIITVGAAAIHSMGFKQGGLLAQLINMDEGGKSKSNLPLQSISHCLEHVHSLDQEDQILLKITNLQEQIEDEIEFLRDLVLKVSSSTSSENHVHDKVISSAESLAKLSEKVCKFVTHCDSEVMSSRALDLVLSKSSNELRGPDSTSSGNPQAALSTSTSSVQPSSSNGRIPRMGSLNEESHLTLLHEEWEGKTLSVNSAFSNVVKSIHRTFNPDREEILLMERASPETQQLESLQKLKLLQELVTMVTEESVAATTLAGVKQQNNYIAPEMLYRRNAVFSQALTSCIAGASVLLYSSLRNPLVLHQFAEVGIFMQVESLLSTYGNEQGMLQDYAAAVLSLAKVAFKCEFASADRSKASTPYGDIAARKYLPRICGNLDNLTVTLFFGDDSFKFLSKDLQNGKLIKVHPVIFNVGINQEQTLAETFGNTALQEYLNMEAMSRTLDYYELVQERCPSIAQQLQTNNPYRKNITMHDGSSPDRKKATSSGISSTNVHRPVEALLNSLSAAVHSKKSKNTEVLQLAAEACYRMNGIRVTSCKSAKDRSAMSVTLEQARILANNHEMAQHAFPVALNCMRSQGTRPQNTLKNTGSTKYAFTSMQLLTFPKLYRPPDGTYGKGET